MTNSTDNQHTDTDYQINSEQTAYSPFDLFSLLRYIESKNKENSSLLGKAGSPKLESVKFVQSAKMAFPKTEINHFKIDNNKIEIDVNNFGLLAINSPLPLHLIEYIFQRKHHYGDGTWTDFVNTLQNRAFALFYRSWANAQSVLYFENTHTNNMSRYLKSLNGLAEVDLNSPCYDIDEYTKLFYSGFLFERNKSTVNLVKLLSQYFGLKIQIQENIGEWCQVEKDEQFGLSAHSKYSLGDGLLLGNRIYDTATKIRIIVGPVNINDYMSFLKGGKNYTKLAEWIDLYLGQEYNWEVQPILDKFDVPQLTLSGTNQIGVTSWLGNVQNNVGNVIVQSRRLKK